MVICGHLRTQGFSRVNYGFTRYRSDRSIGAPEDVLFLTTCDPSYAAHYFRGGFYARTPVYRWASTHVGAAPGAGSKRTSWPAACPRTRPRPCASTVRWGSWPASRSAFPKPRCGPRGRSASSPIRGSTMTPSTGSGPIRATRSRRCARWRI
ncbi:MAG: autoinducer binding domain-containing protein [Rhodobacterales bacterium]|nr:autoinducer binding domain-containing protein [Rhodobacterales bacterium]